MRFWSACPPKSAIEYSSFERRMKIGKTKTAPNYTATKKRAQQNRGKFFNGRKKLQAILNLVLRERGGYGDNKSTHENNIDIPLDFKARKCYNKSAEGMS